jgi:hypothetical protein
MTGVLLEQEQQQKLQITRAEPAADGQLEDLKGVLARHLDRFAFREAPLQFDWQDA